MCIRDRSQAVKWAEKAQQLAKKIEKKNVVNNVKASIDDVPNYYQMCIRDRGKGLVYAIAPNCDAAIFAAGHAGNGAFWLNPNTGKWSGKMCIRDSY